MFFLNTSSIMGMLIGFCSHKPWYILVCRLSTSLCSMGTIMTHGDKTSYCHEFHGDNHQLFPQWWSPTLFLWMIIYIYIHIVIHTSIHMNTYYVYIYIHINRFRYTYKYRFRYRYRYTCKYRFKYRSKFKYNINININSNMNK